MAVDRRAGNGAVTMETSCFMWENGEEIHNGGNSNKEKNLETEKVSILRCPRRIKNKGQENALNAVLTRTKQHFKGKVAV